MRLSVVIPVFNEEPNLRPLYDRLKSATAGVSDEQEFIFVDDGSHDGSADVIASLAEGDPRVRLLRLSRNFGHEAATTCGLDHATGDAVVLIDADLQDPPEVIPDLVAGWRSGCQVVYAQRRRRDGESWVKRGSARAFYRVLQRLADVPIPRDTGDFRIMDRAVVEVIRRCRENPRFVRGLVAWAGFRQKAHLYDREPRHGGETKYSPLKLLRLSFVAISAFSLAPLRLCTYLGAVVTLVSLLFAVYMAVMRILFAAVMPWQGYALLTCAVFFLGGVQLIMLGIVSYYLGLVFQHTQGRPIYVLAHGEAAR